MTEQQMTIESIRTARDLAGGWWLVAGERVSVRDIMPAVEAWMAEQGGVYLLWPADLYGLDFVECVGRAPTFSPDEQRTTYSRPYPSAVQVEDRSQWPVVSITMQLLGCDGAQPEIRYFGYGEDHGDDVRENARAWLGVER